MSEMDLFRWVESAIDGKVLVEAIAGESFASFTERFTLGSKSPLP
ncbi:MAG: hypothetical protein U0165_14630 [Polyangiaceae bacterium]